MRTLIITFDPPENVGGVEGRAIGYTKELVARGLSVSVVAFSNNYINTTEEFCGTLLHKYPSKSTSLPRSLSGVLRLTASTSADTMFFLSGAITIFGNLMLAYCRLSRRMSAVFLYGQDILQTRRSSVRRFLLTTSLFLAKRVVTNSSYTSSLLPPFARAKAGVLYPSVDPSVGGDINVQRQTSGKRVLFVGRLVKRKGLDDLLDAFSLLSNDYPDVRLEIVGDGPERRGLEHKVTEIGLERQINFSGTLRGGALYERYLLCDVFVMPSKTLDDDVEGFGTVFLEAALFGKPSVGTTSGGIPEAVLDGVTGILVEEQNAPKLASALASILTQDSLALRLGQNARNRVLEAFTWERGVDRLLKVLEKGADTSRA